MANSYQCKPMSMTVKVKTRKHRNGYRVKTINYYEHSYVITCDGMTDELRESIRETHDPMDTVSTDWEMPDTELRNDKEHKRAILIGNIIFLLGISVIVFVVATLGFLILEAIFGAN